MAYQQKGTMVQGVVTAAVENAAAKQDDAQLEKERAEREARLKADQAKFDSKPTKGAKFRANTPMLRFASADGTPHFFQAGVLETEDEKLIEELRATCKVPGAIIWEVK